MLSILIGLTATMATTSLIVKIGHKIEMDSKMQTMKAFNALTNKKAKK